MVTENFKVPADDIADLNIYGMEIHGKRGAISVLGFGGWSKGNVSVNGMSTLEGRIDNIIRVVAVVEE